MAETVTGTVPAVSLDFDAGLVEPREEVDGHVEIGVTLAGTATLTVLNEVLDIVGLVPELIENLQGLADRFLRIRNVAGYPIVGGTHGGTS
jgi:hypothetical protein